MDRLKGRFRPLKRRIASFLGLGIMALLLSCLPAWAASRGSLSGIVTHPSGAVVPGAAVIVRNVETEIRQTRTTNGDGF